MTLTNQKLLLLSKSFLTHATHINQASGEKIQDKLDNSSLFRKAHFLPSNFSTSFWAIETIPQKILFNFCSISFTIYLGYASKVRESIDCWQGGLAQHQYSLIWKTVPHCLMWCLWREQNMTSFEDTELGLPDLKLLFFWTLYDWIIATRLFSFSSLQNFLDSCYSFDHQVYA